MLRLRKRLQKCLGISFATNLMRALMNGMGIYTLMEEPLLIQSKLLILIKILCSIKNLLLRGCYLRNIEYCVGIVIYVGSESKIMMNAKKPPKKVSNIMNQMNYMLYTVFGFQFLLITCYASVSLEWNH
jgi:magnesium-transporting ATPase (P-type)